MVGGIFYYGMKEERKIAQGKQRTIQKLRTELEICLRDQQ